MKEHCPNAWLINFRQSKWNDDGSGSFNRQMAALCWYLRWSQQHVGIDCPICQLPLDELTLEYFGLNHLGWIRSIEYKQQNIVPMLIQTLAQMGSIPGFHIDSHLVERLNLIPNEYLYYYYHSRQAVENILQVRQTRGELVTELNNQLFA